MSWYQERMEASAFGWHLPQHAGEGGTYYDRRNAESEKAAAEYRRLHLSKAISSFLQTSGASGSSNFSISRTAEIKHSDYIFPRCRSDRGTVELETTSMPESWLKLMANAAGLVLFLAAVIGLVMRG